MLKAVATKKSAAMSQIAQNRFLNCPYAAMMLVMPIKAMWGGNPLSGSSMRKIMPAAAKNAVVASAPRFWALSFEASCMGFAPLFNKHWDVY